MCSLVSRIGPGGATVPWTRLRAAEFVMPRYFPAASNEPFSRDC